MKQFRYWLQKKEVNQKLRVEENPKIVLKEKQKRNLSEDMQLILLEEQNHWNKYLVKNPSLQVK